jgi:hypothetical protein
MTSREQEEVHHLRLEEEEEEEEERISSSTSSIRGDEDDTTCSSSNTTTREEDGCSSSSSPQLLRDPQRKHPPFVFLLTFFAGLGGFLFGYDTGVISGAMLFLSEEFGIENDNFSKELVVSGAIFGAIFGALFASFVCIALFLSSLFSCSYFLYFLTSSFSLFLISSL